MGVCQKLRELIESQGGELRLGTKVNAIHARGREAVLQTSKGDMSAQQIINCGGLHSDRLATLAGAKPEARIIPFRGEY